MSDLVQFTVGSGTHRAWMNCLAEHADEIERLLRGAGEEVRREERQSNPRSPKPWSPGALWTPDLVRQHLGVAQ